MFVGLSLLAKLGVIFLILAAIFAPVFGFLALKGDETNEEYLPCKK